MKKTWLSQEQYYLANRNRGPIRLIAVKLGDKGLHTDRLARISSFVSQFRRFRGDLEEVAAKEFYDNFGRFRRRYAPIQREAARRFRSVAPEFNVFRVLRLSRKEVMTHSPMLAHLLDPGASHAQGPLFLKWLLTRPVILDGLKEAVDADVPWQIRTESVTEFGNLDIMLWCPSRSVRIVIENKVGAADQPDQLLRYWRWLNQEPLTRKLLCYLTPHGHRSTTADEHGIPYVTLSYRKDIRSMLSDTIIQIKAPRVRETLRQYADIVAAL